MMDLVQGITEIPSCFLERYKTVWESVSKSIIDMAADRGAFYMSVTEFKLIYGNTRYK